MLAFWNIDFRFCFIFLYFSIIFSFILGILGISWVGSVLDAHSSVIYPSVIINFYNSAFFAAKMPDFQFTVVEDVIVLHEKPNFRVFDNQN